MSQPSQDTYKLQAPSRSDVYVTAFLAVGSVVSGLGIFVMGGAATEKDWAWFAYVFMGFASAFFVGVFVKGLHWWCRAHYSKQPRTAILTEEERRRLDVTVRFDAVGFLMGISERAVFTTLALLLLTTSKFNGPLVDGNVGVIASIAGGWIALKTVIGWRRVTVGDPAIMRLSMVGITGSLVSVTLGIVAGVLTLYLYF